MLRSRSIARPCLSALLGALLTVLSAQISHAATCTVGETRSPTSSYQTFDLTGLTVYQRIDPAQCPSCAGAGLLLNQVRWQFRYNGPLCPVTFEVAVVGSDHDPVCPHPDTTNVLCPSFTYVYQAVGGPPHLVTIPFSTFCCVIGQAFVKVKVKDTGGCVPGQLGFFVNLGCFDPADSCRSYTQLPGIPLQDSCDLLGGPETIAVDADCCSATPTLQRSWGRIKTLYR